MLLALVTAERSPFFQHFTVLDLGPFAQAEAVALLTRRGAADAPISPGLATRAVAVLGGNPFYLQLLGETLTANRRTPGLEDLKTALQELLFSRTGRLGLYFENEYNRLVGRATSLAATLDALAAGPLRLSAIATRIQAASGATVRYLERLQDAVVRREDGTYGLADATFGLWLRWRRPGGTVVPMTAGENKDILPTTQKKRRAEERVYSSATRCLPSIQQGLKWFAITLETRANTMPA